jgi:hypothetical protein
VIEGILRFVLRTIALTALFFTLSAPVALASDHDGGEGLWGETNDKVVTYTGFVLIVGFPILILILTLIQSRQAAILILILTLIQSRLDKRKDRRLAAAKARRARADERGGW